MLSVRLKAILIIAGLITAIGVPLVYYSATLKSPGDMVPRAIITSPEYGYVGTPLMFSANKSTDLDGVIVAYIWDFGDGEKSAGKYVNHTYGAAGNYTVRLVVYDNAGNSATTEKKIRIKERSESVLSAKVGDLLENTDDYMGRDVVVRGVFAYGSNYSFYVVDNGGYRGLHVYVERGALHPDKIEYGSVVEILGKFTVYKNGLEIKVENNSRDYVQLTGKNGRYSYRKITMDEWMNYNNSLVDITSGVDDVIKSYKYQMGNLTVYASYGANQTAKPAIGDVFEVRGFLTYYYSRKYNYGYHEIYVRNNTDDFSRYISSRYQDVNLLDVLSEPEKYNNTALHLSDVDVVESEASWNFYVGSEAAKIKVYVQRGGIIEGMIFKGARIDLWGVVSLYKGEWELEVRNGTQDKIIVKNRPEYLDVPVEDLLKNATQYNGSNVHSWGIVSWLYKNESSGFTMFGLWHNGTEVKVVGFSGSNVTNVNEGYFADVYGEFTSYRGEWEIKIRPESYDFVYARPQEYRDVNITDILANASLYNNTLVHVPYAVVTYVYDASWLFYVSNASNASTDISVYVERGGVINGTVYKCAPVEMWGMVTYYAPKNAWEIKIRNSTGDRVVVLKNFEYVNVSMDDLLKNISAYNDTDVHIPNATVKDVIYVPWLFTVSNSTENQKNITVYVERGVYSPVIGSGDNLEIYGHVTLHNGTYEIKIRNCTADRIIVLHANVKYVNLSYIHEVNSDGTLKHLGEQVIVNGTVISNVSAFSFVSSTGKRMLKFYIEDSTGGVLVFGSGLNYSLLNLTDGDVVQVRGIIDQYRGEAELTVASLDYIKYLGHGGIPRPLNLSTGYFSSWQEAEKVEGMLVRINGTVKSVNTQYNYLYLDDGSGEVEVYFKSAFVDISNISVGDKLVVVGIVSQYDKTSPYTSYYEILPRYRDDVVKSNVKNADLGMDKEKKQTSYPDIHLHFCGVIAWKRRYVLTVEDMLAH